jgi:hypothetical protein
MNNLNDPILLAFIASSALRVAAYVPQIVRVARDRAGAEAISCLTWGLWVGCYLVAAVYAWTHTHDMPLTIVLVANAVCCAVVVVLTQAKRLALRATPARQASLTPGA